MYAENLVRGERARSVETMAGPADHQGTLPPLRVGPDALRICARLRRAGSLEHSPGFASRPGEYEAAARELSWFAIRQPAIIRFLQQRLWAPDGDAFAVALDAACRLHEALTVEEGLEPSRVTEAMLRDGLDLEPPAALTGWVEDLCDTAPVMLTPAEEDRVVRALGAIAWGLTTARSAGVSDAVLR